MEESLVNDKLLYYKNDENFLNYMASLRKADDEELKKVYFSTQFGYHLPIFYFLIYEFYEI